MPAPDSVIELVEKFRRNIDSYKSGKYNETEVRREFIDPFFKALGWDTDNESGYAEKYKDVVHEDAIKIGKTIKAPDYSFRIGGGRKFFVEAKKPSVNIKNAPDPAYQVRRYAWTAKLPLSILTDFEEFAVYDCRVKPNVGDKAGKNRILYYTYDQYVQKWDEIAGIFSKTAILEGAFDKYAVKGKKKGTDQVDSEFLKEIEHWREVLAHNIALRNQGITQRQLNDTVQKTIDRIVFLRICEDRGIESEEQLRQAAQSKTGIYNALKQLFLRADSRYNSGLFHFKHEKNRSSHPDEFTLGLVIDDKPLKEIINHLYYPESPYEFSVLPADILGQVYEQFLGKVISLKGKSAVIEDKPEVKKAGGVFYTPTYVVDCIVENTLGELLKGKKPEEVASTKVLDPACGSGSFLIQAYQYLLDWHRDWYLQDEEKRLKKRAQGEEKGKVKGKKAHKPKHLDKIIETEAGWQLTYSERLRILKNNIFGVDIDVQAVEVSKLSLLLKLLEVQNHQLPTSERVLPDLDSNIKCGNSLVGTDFYQQQNLALVSDEQQYKTNAFDWKTEFLEILNAGGFDVVVGNPPYIRIQKMKEYAPLEVEYYKQKFASGNDGNIDIYVLFIQQGMDLLNNKGVLGYILPHKFFNADYGGNIREYISSNKFLKEVIHFGDQQVFEKASTYTCLLFLSKSNNSICKYQRVDNLEQWRLEKAGSFGTYKADELSRGNWLFIPNLYKPLCKRLNAIPLKLKDVTERIFQGLKTSADKIYILKIVEENSTHLKCFSSEKKKEYWLEKGLLHPLIKGGDSTKFHLERPSRCILFPYEKYGSEKSSLVTQSRMKNVYPDTWKYLNDNKDYLESREKGRMLGEIWYAYIYPKSLDLMPLPKIFTPDIAPYSSFSLDRTGKLFFTGGAAGGYGILGKKKYSICFLLGLLNSKLLDFYLKQISTSLRGGYYSFESRFIKNIPIIWHKKNRIFQERCTEIERLVETILTLKEDSPKTEQEKRLYKQKELLLLKEIDQLVYQVYQLTSAEIALVEAF